MTVFNDEINAQPLDFGPSVPLKVFVGEAIDVARLTSEYWQPRGEGESRIAGLSEAGLRVYPGIDGDIVELVNLAQTTHNEYLLIVNPTMSAQLLAETDALTDRIESVLEYAFDDGVEDDKDTQLDQVRANDTDTIDGKAQDLVEVVGLAREHQPLLSQIPLFKAEWLDRGEVVAKNLLAMPPGNVSSPEARAKLGRRNQIMSCIHKRVQGIRSATRMTFFNHPELVRLFTSSYERRRRTALRRAKAKLAQQAQPVAG